MGQKTAIRMDVAWDCCVQDFLMVLEKYDAKIHKWFAVGPGGGNPYFELIFDSREQAQDYLREVYEHNSDLESHLIEL
jgi:hypothetical protein